MITKCNNCGSKFELDAIKSAIEKNEYLIRCKYCGESVEFRKKEATIVERGYEYLLLREFDKAKNCFEIELRTGEASPNAYLGNVLADFNVQVEFEEGYDDANINEKPRLTCSCYNQTRFSEHPSYLKACKAIDRDFMSPLKEVQLKRLAYYADTVDSFDCYYNQVSERKHGESYDLFVAYDDEQVEPRKARKYSDDANKIYNEMLGGIENTFIADPAERDENRLLYEAEILYAIEHSKCMLVVVEDDIGFRLRNIYSRFYGADDLKDRNLAFVCVEGNHFPIALPNHKNADHDHIFDFEADKREADAERMTEFVFENIGKTKKKITYVFSVETKDDGAPADGVTVCGYLNNKEVFSKRTNSRGEVRVALSPDEYEVKVVDSPDGYQSRTIYTDRAGTRQTILLDKTGGGLVGNTHVYKFIDAKHVLFGDYPQKREEAKDVLDYFEDFGLPNRREYHGWKVLFINKKGQPTWYRDEELKGKKYRAIYFDGFRDLYSVQDSDISPSSQTEHHYAKRELYCFAFEPLVWVVEKKGLRQLTLVSESGIDAREYSNDEDMTNEWMDCSLRQWLNHDFLETAFDDQAQQILCSFIGDEEEDKVYLLDKDDDRDFYKQDVVAVRGTDYYQCIGGWGEDSKVEKFWINNHGEKYEEAEASVVTPRYAANTITDYVDSTGVAVLPKIIITRYENDENED